MNVGSLFAGIGGFDLGLERAGMRTLWFAESDPYCQRVLAKHWPGVPCHGDVRELRHPDPVDVLAGGFPCQDLSVAGRGAGLDGERSGLWSEFARLIGEMGPRYVIVENVPALLTRGLERVLADLAQVGYDAEWDCIPASAFGAPHRRDRVWIVAYPGGDRLRLQPGRRDGASGSGAPFASVNGEEQPLAHPSRDAEARTTPQPGTKRERTGAGGEPGDAAHPDLGGRNGWAGNLAEENGRREPADGDWWLVEPDVGRVAHGVPARVDRLRALGNALVPQIAEWLGRRIMEYEGA